MNKTANGDHATTDRLSERAHDTVDQVAKTAGKAEHKIRNEAADAEAYARETGHKVREQVKEQTDDTLHAVSAFVRDNPLISLGLAFTAGTLLSASKRRS